jgi:hypothetical protein
VNTATTFNVLQNVLEQLRIQLVAHGSNNWHGGSVDHCVACGFHSGVADDSSFLETLTIYQNIRPLHL